MPRKAKWPSYEQYYREPAKGIELFLTKASVDGEDLAGDVIGRGEKEDHGPGDLVGGSGTLGGSGGDQALDALVIFAEGDHAGGDGVHRDLGREGFGERARQHDDPGFGGAVMRVLGPGAHAADVTDVHDAASVGVYKHALGGLLVAEKRGLQVDGVDEVPIGFGDVEGIDAGITGRAIDQA